MARGRPPGRLAAAATALAVAAGLLLATPTATAVPAAAAGSDPLKILIVGDSITQGFSGSDTWRYWLDRELRRQGVAFDLVGPFRRTRRSSDPAGGGGTGVYVHGGWDADHAGVGGAWVQGRAAHLPGLMDRYRPDVVMILVGVNNVRYYGRGFGLTPENTVNALVGMVRTVWRKNPRAKVVVGEVMAYQTLGGARSGSGVTTTNRLIASRVPRLANLPGRDVVIAHTNRGWRPGSWTFDGLHPNATGETVVAQRMAEALHAVGVLPQAPHVEHWMRWSPRVYYDGKVKRRRLHLAWPGQRSRLTTTSFRVTVKRHGRTVRRYQTTADTLTTGRLPRGRYRVAVQPIRSRMVGTPTWHDVRVR